MVVARRTKGAFPPGSAFIFFLSGFLTFYPEFIPIGRIWSKIVADEVGDMENLYEIYGAA